MVLRTVLEVPLLGLLSPRLLQLFASTTPLLAAVCTRPGLVLLRSAVVGATAETTMIVTVAITVTVVPSV